MLPGHPFLDRLLILLAATTLLLSGCMTARLAGVGVRETSLADLTAKLAADVTVVTPKTGDGPFPAIVMAHGCGGRQPMFDRYAAIAAEEGVVGIVIDSFRPRDIPRWQALSFVCTGSILLGRERAGDILAGLEIARADARVDPEKLAVAGWSHGGWSIMDLLTMDISGNLAEDAAAQRPQGLADTGPRGLAGVQAALLMYPYCGFPALAAEAPMTTDVPIETIWGDRDIVIRRTACEAIFAREAEARASQPDGARVDIWEGYTHAFDDPDQPAASPHKYNPEAAARAEAAFRSFLRRRLTGQPLDAQTDAAAPAASPAPEAAPAPPAEPATGPKLLGGAEPSRL